MHGLLNLFSAFCLFAALANGSILRAAELAEPEQASAATLWVHADCGGGHVPADEHKNYPHHHSACHGHELAAPFKLIAVTFAPQRHLAPLPVSDRSVETGPPASLLRPPIA